MGVYHERGGWPYRGRAPGRLAFLLGMGRAPGWSRNEGNGELFMRLLNLCCGANRPQDEFWWNLDELHDYLAPGTPERTNLDAEPRYVDHNVLDYLPFPHNEFDGILASHCLEHWDCQQGVDVMRRCLNCLKPG